MNTTKDITLPLLTPRTDPWVEKIVDYSWLSDLPFREGAPIHLNFLWPFKENVQRFKTTAESRGVKLGLFYARKANKCSEFAKTAGELSLGVDTASPQELSECLELGIPGSRLISTASIKTSSLVQLCCQNNVSPMLDSFEEIEAFSNATSGRRKPLEVGIRVSGFDLGERVDQSRFGIPFAMAWDAVQQVRGCAGLVFGGFHFHLDGYSISDRVNALFQVLDLVEKLRSEGSDTKYVDIGGGFTLSYLKSKEQWETFLKVLEEAQTGKHPAVTYRNEDLGMIVHNGSVVRPPKLYPFYSEIHKELFLASILDSVPAGSTVSVSQRLLELDIELRIEPGRALLDHCGATVARVGLVKQMSGGESLVGLEMNSTQLRSVSADFCLDPFFSLQSPQGSEKTIASLVGTYCMEGDAIVKRKIYIPRALQQRDYVIFFNTAGYLMHLLESNGHLYPPAQNIVFSSLDQLP